MKSNNLYIKIAGYLISIIFLYLTFNDTNFNIIVKHLYINNIYFLLIALIFYIAFFLIRAVYQINNLYFIKPDIPFLISFSSLGIAQFYNVIFPARLGEVIRAFFLSRKQGLNKASILSYIFIEKFLDMLVIFVLLLLIIILTTTDTELYNTLSLITILILSITSFIIVYIRFNKHLLFVLDKFAPNSMHNYLANLNYEVLKGLSFYKTTGQVTRSILLLVFSWGIMLGVFWLVSYPYVKLLGMPFYSCLFFMIFSALSLCIPSAPAGIGVMHYGFLLSIKILMGGTIVDSQINLVAAFVINMHFIIMFLDVTTGGGIMVLYKIMSSKV